MSLFASTALAAGPTGLLNDTGQTLCANPTNTAMEACSSTNTGDASAQPRQDGRFGRDRASPTKVGGGAAGFDFTRICWGGAAEGTTVDTGLGTCTGTLVSNTTAAASGTPATDWACTKDNVTNLIWSLQSQSRTWGDATGSSFPDAGHNAVTRCGYSTGWRLPTRRELLSLVDNSRSNPAIDTDYFPGVSGRHWSINTSASNAWAVSLNDGGASAVLKGTSYSARLVRSGQ